ncbi:unannotated protein [freshwater metagenome]|uniref:Unannotated protein n=1 Tax=freshwater metagenome TaxID=449393 RepID=A0A6J7IXK6_9ZZZZ
MLGAAPVIAALIALAGCGGGASQDADEPRGTYTAEITQASFPPLQGLGQTSRMRVTVRNAGRETIPDVALTVDGLAAREAQPDAMDASRPIWVIDLGPVGGKTAYVNTWALGPLAAGRERTFTFVLTAMTAGTHLVRYRVGAGLNGNAIARTPADTVPEGSFTVRITRRPRVSSVNPRTGAVIHRAP